MDDMLRQMCIPLGNGDYICFMDARNKAKREGKEDEYAAYRTEVLIKLGLTLSGAEIGPTTVVSTSVDVCSKNPTRTVP